MAVAYELALNGQTKKVVEVDDSLGVGDAVILDDEIWLVYASRSLPGCEVVRALSVDARSIFKIKQGTSSNTPRSCIFSLRTLGSLNMSGNES